MTNKGVSVSCLRRPPFSPCIPYHRPWTDCRHTFSKREGKKQRPLSSRKIALTLAGNKSDHHQQHNLHQSHTSSFVSRLKGTWSDFFFPLAEERRSESAQFSFFPFFPGIFRSRLGGSDEGDKATINQPYTLKNEGEKVSVVLKKVFQLYRSNVSQKRKKVVAVCSKSSGINCINKFFHVSPQISTLDMQQRACW